MAHPAGRLLVDQWRVDAYDARLRREADFAADQALEYANFKREQWTYNVFRGLWDFVVSTSYAESHPEYAALVLK